MSTYIYKYALNMGTHSGAKWGDIATFRCRSVTEAAGVLAGRSSIN